MSPNDSSDNPNLRVQLGVSSDSVSCEHREEEIKSCEIHSYCFEMNEILVLIYFLTSLLIVYLH